MLKQAKVTDFFKVHSKKVNFDEKFVEMINLSSDNEDDEICTKSDDVIKMSKKRLKLENESVTDLENNSILIEINKNSTMTYFNEIVQIRTRPCLQFLFNNEEHKLLDDFDDLDSKSKLICFKLFTRKLKWYKIDEFLNKIQIQFSIKNDQIVCIDNLFNKRFVNVSGKNSNDCCSSDDLLDMICVNDLKNLCKMYKIVNINQPKSNLVQRLLETCQKQTTLCFSQKSSNEVLKEKLQKLCGPLIMLNENFRNLLNRIYFLYNLSNNHELRSINDIHFFMYKISAGDLILPTFHINENAIFSSRDVFLNYERLSNSMTEILDEIESKNYSKVLKVAICIFNEFESYLKHKSTNDLNEDKHFSIYKKYCSILSVVCKALWNRYPKYVHKFLEMLLKLKHDYKYKAGKWYFFFAVIKERFFKEPIKALEIMLEALHNEEISLIDRYEMKNRAVHLMNKKSIKIPSNLRISLMNILDTLNEDQVDDRNLFPVQIIRAISVHGTKPGQKRRYMNKSIIGESSYDSVENVVINYYKTENKDKSIKGIHTEGILLTTLFNFFFWDIIYDDQNVSSVFINCNQYLPLDFYTETFYLNRKNFIDQRLADIANNWSYQKLFEFLSEKWHEHHLKKSILSSLNQFDLSTLIEIVSCIDRTVISLIFHRLISHFKSYHSGFPDLFIWFNDEKKCIFAEVKSKNDKFSIKQKLWLHYLRRIGANVHLCYVYGIGEKLPKN